MIKLSQASKMPCPSWSLLAFDTCPGAHDLRDGSVVPACRGCYARGGFYKMPTAIASREHNREDWQRAEWVDEMVAALTPLPLFRWFDSGDAYTLALAEKILQVMQRTPGTRHWFPTRMGKFAKFTPVLRTMADLPNVAVRHSSDSVTGETIDYGYGVSSTIAPTAADAPAASNVCGAYTRGGKCGPCRDCWDKTVRVITYPAHGAGMQKVIRLLAA